MTPEEHIAQAEKFLKKANNSTNLQFKQGYSANAEAHIAMARYKQEFEPALPLDRYESTR